MSSGASMPRRRTRVVSVLAGRQMHPRLKRVAIDGADHVDGTMLGEVAGMPPDRLEFLRPAVIPGRQRQMQPLPHRQHGPRHDAEHENPRQERRKTGAEAEREFPCARSAAVRCLISQRTSPEAGLSRAQNPARVLSGFKNPRRCPCSPNRHSAWVPGPSVPEIPFPSVLRWPRRACGALRLRRARAGPPGSVAFRTAAFEGSSVIANFLRFGLESMT